MKWRYFYTVLAAIAVVGTSAASAQAHSSQILIQSSTLIYQELPNHSLNYNNNVTIALKSDSTGSYYEISDPGSFGVYFPSQCTPLDPFYEDIRCPSTGISALYVRLGTGYSSSTTTADTVTITAPTPATVSGGSVTNAGGPRTSDITVGPVGGNVVYGNPGSGVLNSLNGFADTIHACPGNVVQADSTDTVIWDCAPPPDPPGGTSSSRPPGTSSPPPGTSSSPPPGTSSKPPPGTSSKPPPGTWSASVGPMIKLTYKPQQAITLRRRLIVLRVSVRTPLTLDLRATIMLPAGSRPVLLGKTFRVQAVGVAVPVKLRVPRRLVAPLLRAFDRQRRLYARVRVTATDPASGASYRRVLRIALLR